MKALSSYGKRILNKSRKEFRIKYSNILFKNSLRRKESEKLLASLKDIHKGRRGFIICNGPSLKAADLDKINENGDISIASNKIDKIFPQTPWRPTYYCVSDEGLQFSLLDTMIKVPAQAKFFRTDSFCVTRKVKTPTVWLNVDGNRAFLDHPEFSENIQDKIYAIATVTYMLLQIAVYMGIRELYIIGCDNSYSVERQKDGTIINKGGQSYFEGSDEKDNKKNVGASWEMNIAYDYAKKYADEHGIRIYNATRGGHLESFERVEFDSLF